LAEYYDDTGTQPLEEVLGEDFTPALAYCSHGSHPGRLWYRFEAANVGEVAADQALLWIRLPNLDLITLHYQDDAGNWQQMVTGDTLALKNRPLASSKLGFQLDMSEIEGRPVYLGIQSTGVMTISLTIDTLAVMQNHQVAHNIKAILFFSALWLCLAAIAIIYFQTRARIFLYFVISQLTYIFTAFSYTGYLSLLFPTIATDAITTQWIMISVIASTAFQFELFRTLKVKRWALIIMAMLVAAFAALPIAYLFLDARIILNAIWNIGLVYSCFSIVAAWNLSDETYISKRAMRIIFSLYAIPIAVWILPNMGLVPANVLGFYGEFIRGFVNMSLILSILFLISRKEEEKRRHALAQIKKLEEESVIQNHLSQMYRDILWTISHEFGNGLSIFRFGLSKPQITEQNKARMERALKSLEELLAKFKHSEQVELGAISFQDTKIDLVALVKEEAKTASGDDATVKFQFYKSQDISVMSDEVCLRLIMSNILSNAVKYAAPDTPISISLEENDTHASVVVKNECPTLALPDPDRVFDRFYRDPHVLEKAGSGLGLYVVQQLSKLLKGGCRFEIINGNRVRVTAWVLKKP
jgi:signal transduction histidine kinase